MTEAWFSPRARWIDSECIDRQRRFRHNAPSLSCPLSYKLSTAMNPRQPTAPLHPTALLVALIMATGLALCGYFVSRTLYNAKVAANTAQAKGLAERRVTADLVVWTVSVSVSGKSRDEIPTLYETAETQQSQIIELLKSAGFEESEIRRDIIEHSEQEYRDENQILVEETHRLSGSISVSTTKVEAVAKAREAVNQLLASGMDISNNRPAYHFTKINEIKPAMLKEAAENARIAATEFAENAGAKVGRIRSASQGGFIIQDAGGPGDTDSLVKDVRVVTTIDFYLTD